MDYEVWTRKLKVLRLRRGWRQEDVVQKMPISRSQYSAIENGRSVVNYHHLLCLAKIFGMKLADFMSMKGVSLPRKKRK